MQRDRQNQRLERPDELRDARRPPLERVPGEQVDSVLEQRRAELDELAPRVRPVARRASTSRAPTLRQLVRRSFSSKGQLRQAIVLQEILGPPKALRDRDDV